MGMLCAVYPLLQARSTPCLREGASEMVIDASASAGTMQGRKVGLHSRVLLLSISPALLILLALHLVHSCSATPTVFDRLVDVPLPLGRVLHAV